jgi:hypothetical protein
MSSSGLIELVMNLAEKFGLLSSENRMLPFLRGADHLTREIQHGTREISAA